MFRVKHKRRHRRRWTVLRATPTTFGIVGRLVMTVLIVGPLLFVVAAMARTPQDRDGQFNAFFFIVVPAALALILLFVPPLWRPGRRYRRPASLPVLLSRRGTRSSSSRTAPR